MVDASTFDNERESLPYLTLGQYELDITRTEKATTFSDDEYFFVEGSVRKSEGTEALPAGSDFKHGIKLNVSKKATRHMVERVRSFVAAATGRRKLTGAEMITLLDDSSNFEGKSLKCIVAPQQDEDGEPVLKDDGTPWTETKFAAL